MASRSSRARRALTAALAAVVVLLVGIWLGGHPSALPGPLRSGFFQSSGDRLINQALSVLTTQYYRPLDRGKLVDQGLTGMVASLDDPYSHYFDAASYRQFLNVSNPHLSGIGIDVAPDSRGLRVAGVFPGSPAARAGLTLGDVIVEVGSTSLAGRSLDFGAQLIKGAPRTRVILTILRGHTRRVIPVVRANLVVPVSSEQTLSYRGIRIGYLTLTSFTDGSGDQLRANVGRALDAHVRALVLDLRENGGGLLNEAVNVGSIFIPDGTIVSTDGRSQPREVYRAEGNALAPRLPMVVLVDRGTASAAEIVTGALQDRRRAKVVGTHTYGKGVFQQLEPLPGGGALDITVGEYFTPNGRNLGGGGVREGAGIAPDVTVADNPRSSVDTALRTAERTVAAEAR